MTSATATWAVVRKDLTSTVRSPLFLALSVLIPLVFVGIFALVIETSATNPIAVARHGQGPHSEAFVEVLQEIRSADGHYFDVTTVDPGQAKAAYEARKVPGVIHLPADFDRRVADGGAQVTLEVFNIDSDATKNLQLRLDRAIRRFEQAHLPGEPVAVEEVTVFPNEIPMSRYFGTALLVFAVLYLAMVNTGTLVANEWEERTAKAVVLSPLGFGPLIAGKWLAGATLTTVGLTSILGVLAATLNYPALDLGALAWFYLGTVFLFGAAIGALLGVRFQNALVLVPASAVISVTHLLLSGFESYIRGFAHDGALRWMWQAGAWWPASALTDDIRLALEGSGGGAGPDPAAVWMVALAAGGTALAVRRLRHHLTFAQSM